MIIYTERLQLEKYQPEDFHLFRQLTLNPQVMKHIAGKTLSEEVARKKFDKYLFCNKQYEEVGAFKIYLKNKNIYIGTGKLEMVSDAEAELGYSMFPEFWGQGYGTEIANQLMKTAVEVSYIKKLIAYVDPGNIPSKRILEGCGFVLQSVGEMNGLPCATFSVNLKNG